MTQSRSGRARSFAARDGPRVEAGRARRRAPAVASARVESVHDTPLVIQTARPRAGRRFEPSHELELEVDALQAAQALPGAHRGLLVLQEMAGPFGVPDLLAVVGRPDVLEARRALAVPPLLNQVDAGVVAAAAPRAPRTPETLARRVGWPVETVRRRLPELLRSGALLRSGGDSYVRPAALHPVGRLFAIETKVKDWRRAIRQARTYSLWCDSYVVVMASLGAGSLGEVREAIGADGGGLMVARRWVQRPRPGKRSPRQRLWGSEHLLAAMTPESD
jgi:hypothetical protein